MSRVFARCVLVLALLSSGVVWGVNATAWASSGYYWQVGAHSSDSTDEYASGVRSYLGHYALPQYEPSGATVYVWDGTFLSDGSFYQSGTTTNYSGCATQMSEFAQGFAPDGSRTVAIDVACGLTISTYAPFSVYEYSSMPGGQYEWLASGATGTLPGSAFYAGASTIGASTPFSVAELSDSVPISTSSQLGSVGADPALETEFGGQWFASSEATAYYGYQATCPPLDVVGQSVNRIIMGTGINYRCVPSGTNLW